MTPSQSAQIAKLAASPAGLAYLATNGKYELPAHVRHFNRMLLAAAQRDVRRLMIFCPPRHGKSSLVSHYFPAWYLATHPEHRVILSSYEADFAASWGRKARDVLTEWGPQLYGVRVRDDSSAANRWDLADHAGGMTTAGAGGPITGRGADVFIIDDPIKNAEEALSPVRREHLWDWFQSTAYTRLEPNGIIVITLTRWHDEDLAGHLLKSSGEAWEVVSFPALAEEADALGRREGDALWPERFSVATLAEIRATIESDAWWYALYQQRPTPVSGVIFQRQWFDRRYRTLPTMTSTIQAVDSAFKDGVASDYSVIATWGTDGRDYYLLDIWRARVPFPGLVQAIRDQAARWTPEAVLIEDKASGQSAIQVLVRESNLPIIGVPAEGSKVSRAEGVSPLCEAGKVLLPDAAPWLAEWIDEHVRFPRAAHDDQVDTTGYALARLRHGTGPRIRFFD